MSDIKTNVTQDAAVRLMLKFPYWSELYYTMTIYEDRTSPTLSTDGRNMWVNPTFWTGLTLDLKIAALAHEVGHKMLLHNSRRGTRHPMLWNIAADYVVNGILAENGFTLGEGWLHDEKYLGWTVEAVYADIERQAIQQQQVGNGDGGNGEQQKKGKSQAQGGSQGQPGEEQGEEGDGSADGSGGSADGGSDPSAGDGQGAVGNAGQGGGQGSGGGFDVPGVTQQWKDNWQDIRTAPGTKEEVEKMEREVLQAVEKAIQTAKAHGRGVVGMDGFEDLMKPSKEPWYNHLHRYMQSLSMSEYNWARINRRHLVQHQIFTPDNFSEALEHVVFFIDCSGSVFNAADQANFAGHVNAILAEAKPKHTHVLYFDSAVTRHDELDYGALDFSTRPAGGGGTDFRPCFKELEELGIAPEVCIVLTDCYGDFPREEPPYPVLWASTVDPECLGRYYPPFGDVIHVEE